MRDLLQPHDPNWTSTFATIRQVLQDALANTGITCDIQHVGSTAIPGLVAKPVLDIDIIIEDRELLPPVAAVLETLGYISKGDQGIPGRWTFRQSSFYTPFSTHGKPWMNHHLYVCTAGSLALKNHLLFRDALLASTELVEAYSTLKQSLVSDPSMSREKYTRLKTDFILSVLASKGMDAAALQEIRDANT